MKNIRFTQLTSECDLLNNSIFYLNQDNSTHIAILLKVSFSSHSDVHFSPKKLLVS